MTVSSAKTKCWRWEHIFKNYSFRCHLSFVLEGISWPFWLWEGALGPSKSKGPFFQEMKVMNAWHTKTQELLNLQKGEYLWSWHLSKRGYKKQISNEHNWLKKKTIQNWVQKYVNSGDGVYPRVDGRQHGRPQRLEAARQAGLRDDGPQPRRIHLRRRVRHLLHLPARSQRFHDGTGMRELTPHHQQLDKFIICLTLLTQSLSSLKSLCMHQHTHPSSITHFFLVFLLSCWNWQLPFIFS